MEQKYVVTGTINTHVKHLSTVQLSKSHLCRGLAEDVSFVGFKGYIDHNLAESCVCVCRQESGFRLLGDFRDVARSVDYLVIDLWEGWKTHTHTQDVLACVQGFNPMTNMLTPPAVYK